MKILKQIIITCALTIFSAASLLLNAQELVITDLNGKLVPKKLLIPISIELTRVPIVEALNEIANKGEFHLNYSESIIPVEKKVSIKFENLPATLVLKKILEQVNLDFVISTGEQIVLVKSKIEKNQKKYTISGYVTDAASGEALVGTNIYVGNLHTGCSTNGYGFYSLTIPAGDYAVSYNHIGYKSSDIPFSLNRSIKYDVELKEIAILGETVIVTAETEDRNVESTDMGTIHFIPFKLNTIPVFLGEQDIFRTVQMLPGVAHGREGSCGFFVRGGNSDQNLILLDEAPVYNAYHLLGFFSVFNSDALKDVKLIKGAAPAKYGGRLSSVLDIQLNEGNSKKLSGNAGIGLIFSRLTLQCPIIKDTGSYIIAGRRTYADLFTRFAPDSSVKNSTLYFYDFNAKANYRISSNDRLYLSGYFGKDRFAMNEIVDISWGNRTATLRWNHLISNKLFLNSSLIFSDFKYITKVIEDSVVVTSEIDDFTLKEDFQFFSIREIQ